MTGMGARSVRESKATGRIAARAALAGVIGASVLLGGGFLIEADAAPVTVAYTCTAAQSGATHAPELTVSLAGPASAAPSQPVTVVWANTQPTEPGKFLPAPGPIPATQPITLTGQLVVAGPSATTTAQAAGSSTPGLEVPSGVPVPLPPMTATVTPAAAGAMTITAQAFTLQLSTGDTPVTYSCTPAPGATPASHVVTVAAGPVTSPTPSGSASPSLPTSPSPTPSPTTPRPTRTVYKTVTMQPTQGVQVTRTPKGGANTGGGGEAGPDGRVLILTGGALVLASAAGGLALRARTRGVRQRS